jgi:Xaa-Pro aminopeptidase
LFTMHPTMLVGPYDWDSKRLPKDEFLQRIQNFWHSVSDPKITNAIVYGDSRNHAELAYLSYFTPKLGPALMLIPRDGVPRLLVSGAPNMLPAARRLTWIEDVEPLRDAGKTIVGWAKGGAVSASIGGGYSRAGFYRSLLQDLGDEIALVDQTAALRTLMRNKRPRELATLREACEMLTSATLQLTAAKQSGAGITAAVLEAERTANRAGAQDMRTLISLDGGRTLRPFENVVDGAADPLQAYMAVRHAGYWADGFICLAASRYSVLEKAVAALKAVAGIAKAGAKSAALFHLAREAINPYHPHAMTSRIIGNSIGLSLAEEPQLCANGDESLEAGCVYTLRVGVSDGRQRFAIVSAMVAVHADGSERLWSAI